MEKGDNNPYSWSCENQRHYLMGNWPTEWWFHSQPVTALTTTLTSNDHWHTHLSPSFDCYLFGAVTYLGLCFSWISCLFFVCFGVSLKKGYVEILGRSCVLHNTMVAGGWRGGGVGTIHRIIM